MLLCQCCCKAKENEDGVQLFDIFICYTCYRILANRYSYLVGDEMLNRIYEDAEMGLTYEEHENLY